MEGGIVVACTIVGAERGDCYGRDRGAQSRQKVLFFFGYYFILKNKSPFITFCRVAICQITSTASEPPEMR